MEGIQNGYENPGYQGGMGPANQERINPADRRSVNPWLENRFIPECPIRTPEEFAQNTLESMNMLQKSFNLVNDQSPSHIKALKKLSEAVRESLSFGPNEPCNLFW